MSPDEIKARMGEIERGYNSDDSINQTVDSIRKVSNPADRLDQLRAVFEGKRAVEKKMRDNLFTGNLGKGLGHDRWGTGSVSPWENHAFGPLVGCSLGAPPCRFDRFGRPELDYAAMRFIVAAHENFEFLLELAAEGLAAREKKAEA